MRAGTLEWDAPLAARVRSQSQARSAHVADLSSVGDSHHPCRRCCRRKAAARREAAARSFVPGSFPFARALAPTLRDENAACA
eukprot:3620180-Pleurochrysis_carterae.AAC.2